MQEPDFSFSGLVPVAEFCRREKISKNLAYKLIREGKLPVRRLSPRNIRVNVAALRAELTAVATASKEPSK